MRFHVENMTCSGCVRSVTRAVQSIDRAAVVNADLATRKVEVQTVAAPAEIEAVLSGAGYEAVREQA